MCTFQAEVNHVVEKGFDSSSSESDTDVNERIENSDYEVRLIN